MYGVRVAMSLWGLLAFTGALLADEAKSRAEIVKAAKPATALVDLKPRYGSAFCLHPSGLFITNEHVVRSASAATLVLDAGLKTQKLFKAKVLRADKELDLALLQAEGAEKLPALALGSDDKLAELSEVIAFGFPFGVALGKEGAYPNISVNVGSVTSLRRDKGGELYRIQLDAVLNPGNSGGPVLDNSGKVVGVVVSGIKGAGINLAIPVSHVQRFVARPEIVFSPPNMAGDNRHKPLEFRARLVSLLSDPKGHELELVLSTGPGKERRFPMKLADGAYAVTAVPFPPPPGPETLRVTVKYEDGAVTGMAEDRTLQVGLGKVQLSEVRSLRLGPRVSAKMSDGRTMYGKLAGLDSVSLKIAKKPLTLELADAVELAVEVPEQPTAVSCVVVARLDGKEVARTDVPVYRDSGVQPSLDAVANGKFFKPARSAKAVSYLRAISSKGDYIGQGNAFSYTGDQLTVRRNDRGVSITVDDWNIHFGAPRGKFLAAGEYPNAKRFPFSDDAPGIEWYGKGRGANRIAGAFVVWEIELKGNEITRLAIDFIQRCEETMPPLYGMIRYNSTFH